MSRAGQDVRFRLRRIGLRALAWGLAASAGLVAPEFDARPQALADVARAMRDKAAE